MAKNLNGSHLETLEFEQKMYKSLYNEIYGKARYEELRSHLEKQDTNNDGKLTPHQIAFFVQHVTAGSHQSPFSDEQIESFVSTIPTRCGLIDYIEFLTLLE